MTATSVTTTSRYDLSPRDVDVKEPMESKYDFLKSLRYRNLRKLIYWIAVAAVAAGCSGKKGGNGADITARQCGAA